MNFDLVLNEIKENKQDFEWYPTSKETIDVLYRDIKRSLHAHQSIFNMMDVGAGNGKVLTEVAKLSETEKYGAKINKAYAVEKSSILIQQMDKDIFVLGTEFDEQTFIDKKVDIIYSNPPYSEFEKWSEKLIKEANCKVLYLLIPQRWENSHKIKQALEYREKEATVIQEYDFTNSEDRKARAKVNLIKIAMEEFITKKSDPFAKWFNDTFQFKAEKPKNEFEEKREQRERIKELVTGGNLIKTLVELYNKDMSNLMQSYAKIAEIDTSILNELNIDIDSLTENARLKIENKKNLYWQELFDNLDKITSRLTHDIRRKMLSELTEHTNIDFTEKNVYAVLIWVLKNANNYFDDQLIKVYKKLTSSDNVKFYKSNEKIVNDGWRFLQQLEEKKVKYTLDYRIIQHLGSPFNYRGNELNETSLFFFDDIFTIANNLGFTVENTLKSTIWETGKKYNFYLKSGDLFMELKIFKNGNAHLKLNQKFMKAFNIEASRLLGWVKKPKEFEEETGIKADEYFKTNHKVADVKLLLS